MLLFRIVFSGHANNISMSGFVSNVPDVRGFNAKKTKRPLSLMRISSFIQGYSSSSSFEITQGISSTIGNAAQWVNLDCQWGPRSRFQSLLLQLQKQHYCLVLKECKTCTIFELVSCNPLYGKDSCLPYCYLVHTELTRSTIMREQ